MAGRPAVDRPYHRDCYRAAIVPRTGEAFTGIVTEIT